MRAYTVKELDALRRAVRNKYIWGKYKGPKGTVSISISYNEKDMVKYVEEVARTHMIAGHTAEDLILSEAT